MGIEASRADVDAVLRSRGIKRRIKESESAEDYFKRLEENGELIFCSVTGGRSHRRECLNTRSRIKRELSRAIEGASAWQLKIKQLKMCHKCDYHSGEELK